MAKCKCLINGHVVDYNAAFPATSTMGVSRQLEYIGVGVIIEVNGNFYDSDVLFKFYKTVKKKSKYNGKYKGGTYDY